MDREALLLYLQNLRDLEVARYWLRANAAKEQKVFKRQRAELTKTDYFEAPEAPAPLGCLFWGCVVMAALYLLCTAFFSLYAGTSGDGWVSVLLIMGFFLFGGVALAIFYAHSDEQKKYKEQQKKVSLHNQQERRQEEENRATLSTIKQDWKNRAAWYQQELDKLDGLLQIFYDMNIIPVQFRNLSAVCYIYDYMSTSRESLTSALFDQHMEDGIRRIEEKLDSLISSLESMVYETRCIREKSERMIAQNNRMLESLQCTEQNSLQAAQYAELSANYSKANAYFSLATYLKH